MKDCNAVDLPNYGVIEGQLEQEDLDYVCKLIHKYAPKSEWEGNRLLSIEDTNDKQWSLADDEQLFANAVLMPMTQKYFDTYGCPFKIKSTHDHGLAFSRFWCRASHEGDYQSIHDHQNHHEFHQHAINMPSTRRQDAIKMADGAPFSHRICSRCGTCAVLRFLA